jgi:hypothetical protein
VSATAAAIFEAAMSPEQVERLAELMRDGLATRPDGVVTAALLVDGERVQLVAFWRDRTTLDDYLAAARVPRGVELMRKAGVEPEMRIVDVREFA